MSGTVAPLRSRYKPRQSDTRAGYSNSSTETLDLRGEASRPTALQGASSAVNRGTISISEGNKWLIGTVALVVLVYDLIGVNDGVCTRSSGTPCSSTSSCTTPCHILGCACH